MPSASPSKSMPQMRTLPASFCRMEHKMLMVVLLPAPFTPKNENRLPRSTRNEMPCTARTFPYALYRPSTCTMSSCMFPSSLPCGAARSAPAPAKGIKKYRRTSVRLDRSGEFSFARIV